MLAASQVSVVYGNGSSGLLGDTIGQKNAGYMDTGKRYWLPVSTSFQHLLGLNVGY
jgi:hypothetical protein